VSLIGELIKTRQEQGIIQKQLEEMSGVKQPVIARMEKGYTSPQIYTILKVLAPFRENPCRRSTGQISGDTKRPSRNLAGSFCISKTAQWQKRKARSSPWTGWCRWP
jgi:transcriptional regulator with XRE-family HTH domain